MPRRAGSVHAHEPLGVVEASRQRSADRAAVSRPECLDRGGAHVRIVVPGQLDERRLAEVGIRMEERRAPEADGRLRVAKQRYESWPRRWSQPLELGGDAGPG